jgi:hypothetical protein
MSQLAAHRQAGTGRDSQSRRRTQSFAALRRIAALGALGALTSVGLASCGSPALPTSTDSLGAPLVAAVAGSTGTWMSLPAGQLGSPATTYWQLVHGAGSSWRLETPPGVATNGGLVTSLGPHGQLVVGIEPSQRLLFSPLVSRATPTGPWTTGAVPAGLAAVPDALATSSNGRLLAIVTTNGGEVLSSPGACRAGRVSDRSPRSTRSQRPRAASFARSVPWRSKA